MGINHSKNCRLSYLWAAGLIGIFVIPSPELPRPEIVVEGLKRVSANEVHLAVKITNTADKPIFLAGIKYKTGPSPELIFVEQRLASEDWKTITCVENGPPDVIKLNPGRTITRVIWWKVPEVGVCKNRITRWEGMFRFRLEYFESAKQARAYVNKIFSLRWREARANIAFSGPFEIPPVADP